MQWGRPGIPSTYPVSKPRSTVNGSTRSSEGRQEIYSHKPRSTFQTNRERIRKTEYERSAIQASRSFHGPRHISPLLHVSPWTPPLRQRRTFTSSHRSHFLLHHPSLIHISLQLQTLYFVSLSRHITSEIWQSSIITNRLNPQDPALIRTKPRSP